jgi:hypothetical protein
MFLDAPPRSHDHQGANRDGLGLVLAGHSAATVHFLFHMAVML